MANGLTAEFPSIDDGSIRLVKQMTVKDLRLLGLEEILNAVKEFWTNSPDGGINEFRTSNPEAAAALSKQS